MLTSKTSAVSRLFPDFAVPAIDPENDPLVKTSVLIFHWIPILIPILVVAVVQVDVLVTVVHAALKGPQRATFFRRENNYTLPES